jgi:hypothetical protein
VIRWIVFTSLKTNRGKLAWLWVTNVSSHNFRQKRCYTMTTFWRTTESVYNKKFLKNITNIFYHLTTKLQNVCRVWYAGSTILNICINETKQYYRNAYYETLDRIYKFEDKQMKTGMTLGHKSFVTQFSTKEVLYYDDFLKNYWKYLHGLLDSHINYL